VGSSSRYCIPLVGHICHQQLGNVGNPEVPDSRTCLGHPGKKIKFCIMLIQTERIDIAWNALHSTEQANCKAKVMM
jgi:hypothetical protein